MRLDRILVHAGHGSRKEMQAAVRAGRVTVDGVPAACSAADLCPLSRAICLDGADIDYAAHYDLLMNKPAGFVSSTDDPRDKTVLDLLPERYRRMGLFPAGRLDKDATGLLLLTTDGQTAHRLLSPKRHVAKTYRVTVDGEFGEQVRKGFAEGVTLTGGEICRPAGLEILSKSEAVITLFEGKYHQIKRMTAVFGLCVTSIHRLTMGSLTLPDTLQPGCFVRIDRKNWPEIFPIQSAQTGEKRFGD